MGFLSPLLFTVPYSISPLAVSTNRIWAKKYELEKFRKHQQILRKNLIVKKTIKNSLAFIITAKLIFKDPGTPPAATGKKGKEQKKLARAFLLLPSQPR